MVLTPFGKSWRTGHPAAVRAFRHVLLNPLSVIRWPIFWPFV
jgi:hypothetical protein